MARYKAFAAAFSYPDRKELAVEYDLLFRRDRIWLYTTEYQAKHDFQKSQLLSDIMAFYNAFGVRPDKERPDAVSAEFEFMHYLIFKRLYGQEKKLNNCEDKAAICADAERKFFDTHLYPGVKAVMEKILARKGVGFYADMAREALSFLEAEKA